MQISFVSLCLLVGLTLVLAAPQNSPPGGELKAGCYWTDCKSLFTYDYKCPSDEFQDNQPDTSECPKGTGKFKCCPEDPSGPSSSASPVSSSGAEGSVLPEAV